MNPAPPAGLGHDLAMRTSRVLGAAALGYLLGTIPFADIASRLAATEGEEADLRAAGSGNPGATNAASVLGKKWGAFVLAADVGKSTAACALGRTLAGDVGAHVGGTASVVGHCFPVWNGFRGGKGVASSVGQVVTTFPAYVPAGASVMGLTVLATKQNKTFAAVLVAAIGWLLHALVWWRRGLPNAWGVKPSGAMPAAATATGAIVLYKFARAPRST
jgi:acyl phosphate:glycerol-3-phosphate acyltransferase